jgi:DNA-binding winged helix-turn-helix (wHTH) protein
MSEPRQAIGSMHFGPFELSTESSELRKHGQRLKLSGQAIDVLLMLASNAGRLVTREDLQRKLWPGESFGDFEHGLNAAVNRLRETLGDSATDPTYIETVPRRGYRFIAQVDHVPNTTDPTAPDNAAEVAPEGLREPRIRRLVLRYSILLAGILLLAGGGVQDSYPSTERTKSVAFHGADK